MMRLCGVTAVLPSLGSGGHQERVTNPHSSSFYSIATEGGCRVRMGEPGRG